MDRFFSEKYINKNQYIRIIKGECDMAKIKWSKNYVYFAFVCFLIIAVIVTIASFYSGKEISQTYKITYGNRVNVSGEEQDSVVGFDPDYSFGVMNAKSLSTTSAISNDSYSELTTEGDFINDEEISNVTLDDLKVKGNYLKWTYDTTVETTEYDLFVSDLANVVKKANGYVERSELLTHEYSNNSFTESYEVRRGIYTIRIPDKEINHLEEVLSSVDIKSSNKYCEDLTEGYIDTETKIKNLEQEHNKLDALLLDATNIQDILAINDRITSIEQELDYYSKYMNELDKDIEFATYNLIIDEVKYYEDTIVKYSSDILQNWKNIATEWLSEIIPIMFFGLITIVPFLYLIGFIMLWFSKKKIDYSCNKQSECNKDTN